MPSANAPFLWVHCFPTFTLLQPIAITAGRATAWGIASLNVKLRDCLSSQSAQAVAVADALGGPVRQLSACSSPAYHSFPNQSAESTILRQGIAECLRPSAAPCTTCSSCRRAGWTCPATERSFFACLSFLSEPIGRKYDRSAICCRALTTSRGPFPNPSPASQANRQLIRHLCAILPPLCFALNTSPMCRIAHIIY